MSTYGIHGRQVPGKCLASSESPLQIGLFSGGQRIVYPQVEPGHASTTGGYGVEIPSASTGQAPCCPHTKALAFVGRSH